MSGEEKGERREREYLRVRVYSKSDLNCDVIVHGM